jgi:hypothetical protein
MDVSHEVLKAGIKNTSFKDLMTCSRVEMFVFQGTTCFLLQLLYYIS